jgi:CRISPR-associated protein Cmr3
MSKITGFQYLITITPLGLLYGSAGAFLSPENLVGRSGSKFPPDAAAVSGLVLSANRQSGLEDHAVLKQDLHIAGPFWAKSVDDAESFYVPIPRHRIVGDGNEDEWRLNDQGQWQRGSDLKKQKLECEYYWQRINDWQRSTKDIRRESAERVPWKSVPFLHPQMQTQQRHVLEKDGLFLENAVQMDEEACLVYLSTHAIPEGWYRLGGEGHMVEVTSQAIAPQSKIYQLLQTKIKKAFALITPGVWGSTRFSYRYPQHESFPHQDIQMLMDRPVPFRYRIGKSERDGHESGRLSRGRYAVPAGSVYVLNQALEKTWWEFPEVWFPQEGFPLRHLGCGLCLPVEIQGLT